MHVILGTIGTINQISNHTWILAVRGENVDVWRVSTDVSRLYGLSTGTEHLKTVETDVVAVAPGGQDVDDEPLALRQHRDLKIVLPLHGWIIIRAFAKCPLSSQRGKWAPGCCHWVYWECGWTTTLTLEELVKDVTFKGHVGDASTLALVEFSERVPGLHEGLILLAVQLGQRGALPPAGPHQWQWLLWRIHKDDILITNKPKEIR